MRSWLAFRTEKGAGHATTYDCRSIVAGAEGVKAVGLGAFDHSFDVYVTIFE